MHFQQLQLTILCLPYLDTSRTNAGTGRKHSKALEVVFRGSQGWANSGNLAFCWVTDIPDYAVRNILLSKEGTIICGDIQPFFLLSLDSPLPASLASDCCLRGGMKKGKVKKSEIASSSPRLCVLKISASRGNERFAAKIKKRLMSCSYL